MLALKTTLNKHEEIMWMDVAVADGKQIWYQDDSYKHSIKFFILSLLACMLYFYLS